MFRQQTEAGRVIIHLAQVNMAWPTSECYQYFGICCDPNVWWFIARSSGSKIPADLGKFKAQRKLLTNCTAFRKLILADWKLKTIHLNHTPFHTLLYTNYLLCNYG